MAEQPAAAERTVDAIIQQAMNDHLRSLVAGQPERVRFDYDESIRARSADFEHMVPPHLKDFHVLHDRVTGDASHLIMRLVGDTTHDVEYIWRHVEGRFRIVDVKRTE